MRIQILILILLTSLNCTNTNNNSKNVERVIEKFDSHPKEHLDDGYVPEHNIDFSHSTHSQINELNDCKKCHVTKGEKVELKICSNCHHNNIHESLNLTYYERLDSISTYIRKMTTPKSK